MNKRLLAGTTFILFLGLFYLFYPKQEISTAIPASPFAADPSAQVIPPSTFSKLYCGWIRYQHEQIESDSIEIIRNSETQKITLTQLFTHSGNFKPARFEAKTTLLPSAEGFFPFSPILTQGHQKNKKLWVRLVQINHSFKIQTYLGAEKKELLCNSTSLEDQTQYHTKNDED